MRPPGTVVIVGAGLAGARCAETLRAEGFEGDVVLVGDEPHAPYERPALSKEFLAGKRSLEDMTLRPESFWADQDIDLCLGNRVVAVDPVRKRATLEDGTDLAWEALVIATGVRARRLPFPTPSGVHVLRTADDAIGLREDLDPGKRLCVIGGGFVGTEVASTAIELGLEVTMLEAAPAPFTRALGSDVGRMLATRYRRFELDLRTGVGAAGFRSDERQYHRRRPLGRPRRRVRRRALAAVGVEPALDLFPPILSHRSTLAATSQAAAGTGRRRPQRPSTSAGGFSGSTPSPSSRPSSGPTSSACDCSSSVTPMAPTGSRSKEPRVSSWRDTCTPTDR